MTGSLVKFLKTEAGGGFALALAAAFALLAANSPVAARYFDLLKTPVALDIGFWRTEMTGKAWVKDGLMAVFFFVVGLELKRELTIGQLSDPRTIALPVAAAFGGALMPVLVYLLIAGGTDMRGWPVPVATDIAFALAALSLLAPKADARLRIFLLTLAVVDDLIAVVLIAALFTSHIALAPIGGALVLLLAVWFLQRHVELPAIAYILLALTVWGLAIESGVHSSVMAVATAAVVPIKGVRTGNETLERLEVLIHPIAAYVVLPIFAFVAAGISFAGLGVNALIDPVPLGIALGLAVGKPLGVAGAAWIAARFVRPAAPPPIGVLLRIGFLCGIGFTMSLFLGGFAFPDDPARETLMRVGVLGGSCASLLLSIAGFALSSRPRAQAQPDS